MFLRPIYKPFSVLCGITGVLTIISGCMVGPDFRRPEAAVSSTWIESADNRVKSEAGDYRNWWRTFDDQLLDRLIDRAYRENLTLRAAGVRVLEARTQLGIAVGELHPARIVQRHDRKDVREINRTAKRRARGVAAGIEPHLLCLDPEGCPREQRLAADVVVVKMGQDHVLDVRRVDTQHCQAVDR